MKTNSLTLRSLAAVLAVLGLQASSVLPLCSNAQAGNNKFFDWENLQTDVPGAADRTDSNLVNPWD